MKNSESMNGLLNQMNDTAWRKMKPQERLDLLQKFENHLAAACGRDACRLRMVPDEILACQKEGTVLNGYFSPQDGCIYVNPKFLTSRMAKPGVSMFHLGAALALIAHEGRHAWQHYVVAHPEKALVDRKERLALLMNFEAYQSGKDSHTLYAAQVLEYDARQFASHVMKQLLKKMEVKDGHASYSIYRAIHENEIREKHYASRILAKFDKLELKRREASIRARLGRKYPGIDFSKVSMFEAAIKLIDSGNVKEYIDRPDYKWKDSQLFKEVARKAMTYQEDRALKVKAAEIKIKREKSVSALAGRRKRI